MIERDWLKAMELFDQKIRAVPTEGNYFSKSELEEMGQLV